MGDRTTFQMTTAPHRETTQIMGNSSLMIHSLHTARKAKRARKARRRKTKIESGGTAAKARKKTQVSLAFGDTDHSVFVLELNIIIICFLH